MSTLNWLEDREEHIKWFGMVESKTHWKKPIFAKVTVTPAEMTKINDAVAYFHGQGLSIYILQRLRDGRVTYRVRNTGYCCD